MLVATRWEGNPPTPHPLVLAFGKYKGKHLDQVPQDYLFWLLDQPGMSRHVLHAIRTFLDVDSPESGWDQDPDPALAAVVLPGRRCARGQGHLAYYRFWREGGRLRKCYVRRADLTSVRDACEARRRERRELAEAWQRWRRMVAVVREVSECAR